MTASLAGAACPLCGSRDGRVGRVFASREVAQHFVRREVDRARHERLRAHIDMLWAGPSCALIDCGGCGFGFTAPFVAGDGMFYELASPGTNYPQWKWEFQRTLDTLRHGRIARARTGPVLDIGAGSGALLAALLAAGWPRADLLGLEYSSSGLAAMRAKGIGCRAADVRDLDAAGPFAVIAMFQVLEHLDGYDRLFATLARLSAPGTDLFIAVPNADWQRANEAQGIGDDYPPNHLSRWGTDDFARLAVRFGWTIAAVEQQPVRRLAAARHAFAERFLRTSERSPSLANGFMRVASRMRRRSAERAVKALGAAVQPGCWRVAFARFCLPSPPANIWVHLSRPDA